MGGAGDGNQTELSDSPVLQLTSRVILGKFPASTPVSSSAKGLIISTAEGCCED